MEGTVGSLQRKEAQPESRQPLQVREITSLWVVYETFSEGVFSASEQVPSMVHLGQEQSFHCLF